MKGAHIAVDAVTHTYRRTGKAAVADISFEVRPGEALALVGRSGCGKSTLLHIMAGLIIPSQGGVLVDGLRVGAPSPKWVVMFQQPSLYPWMSVAQNVALGLRFTGRRREIAARVPELLRLVELSDYADRNVQDLSGGQQQRVALARSLAPSPEVLMLDEPFSALDAFTRGTLQRDVRRIAKDLGITLVLVTHDLAEAVVMADRAAVLSANPGRLCEMVPIDLADRDNLRSPEYADARNRLAAAYEKAAGRELTRFADPAGEDHPLPSSPLAKPASAT
ncbi:ABC transporter ATP-binding protein [Polymorphum gilvum]|uniref:ABC transporter related protein n=1 Tax=Polymorphum gilvum (strain LMG 25793 / CGMCC 1.9160 / SL003B-26A1) TaxID=991905 RepID=F2IYV2_POLGS|nr:ABC transporter ATP-binding protein [Polymorphum gilvum]ADZ70567.1 ABC transporter related protein [Polymorphum gilvum SL003B-26A1]